MNSYKVTSAFSRSRISYLPGQQIEADDETADRLITAGLIEAPAGHKVTPKKAGNNPGGKAAAKKKATTKKTQPAPAADSDETETSTDVTTEVEVK